MNTQFARIIFSATVFVAAGSASAAAAELALVERATSDAVTDLGDKGDSIGDLLTFNNEVYDAANAAAVGRDNGWCIRTAVGQAWECTWTTTLSDGQITVQGTFKDSGDSLLAVTGGTGKYQGAIGEMTLHPRNPEATEYDFKFNLTQ
jgi:allene oxide cyclase